MNLEIDLDQYGRRLLWKLQKLDGEGKHLVRIGVESIAWDARDEFRDRVLSGESRRYAYRNRLRDVTGEMRAAWVYKLLGRNKDRARVYPGRLNYFKLLDRGGEITAKNGKLLRFMIDGEVFFARSVKIPRRPMVTPFARAYDASSRKRQIAERYMVLRLRNAGLI